MGMSFFLVCPNCGLREVYEFRYGGEILETPAGPGHPAGSNLPGPQRERWYHRLGCRRWFTAERDVRSNTVLGTAWLAADSSPVPLSPPGKRGMEEGKAEGEAP
jgi:sarcosine oxidase subunit delta